MEFGTFCFVRLMHSLTEHLNAYSRKVQLKVAATQLIVGGLQLFLRGFQFFVGALQLLVGGMQLFVRRLIVLPRRVSGYNLDSLLPEKGFHVAEALVGSESTCVLLAS